MRHLRFQISDFRLGAMPTPAAETLDLSHGIIGRCGHAAAFARNWSMPTLAEHRTRAKRVAGGKCGHATRRNRRGTIMIITLWIVLILAGLVVVFARSMYVEATASANHVASLQAAAIERGAEQYVLALIDQNQSLQGVMALNLDSTNFAAIPLGASDLPGGYFWVIRPNYGDDSLPVFGLVNEASKVNINYATEDDLMYLPYITDDLAESLIDWRDPDDNAMAFGAESDYYSSLPNAYVAKNAPFETVEELLLVKGWTRALLYGTVVEMQTGRMSQANAGAPGMFDAVVPPVGASMDGYSGSGFGFGNGNVDWPTLYGLYDYLTVYSHEPAAAAATATAGKTGSSSSQARGTTGTAGAVVATARPSGGLINLAFAPREVLYCLGLDDSDVAAIQSYRTSANFDPADISWVNQALPQKAAELANKITSSSYQYSADIVAVNANGRAFKRVRIVVDAGEPAADRVSPGSDGSRLADGPADLAGPALGDAGSISGERCIRRCALMLGASKYLGLALGDHSILAAQVKVAHDSRELSAAAEFAFGPQASWDDPAGLGRACANSCDRTIFRRRTSWWEFPRDG